MYLVAYCKILARFDIQFEKYVQSRKINQQAF